ncbi:MAG: TAXI family TRAP transporter solute-binding subunit [Hyphomicrobiaceae bacterium]
MAIIENVFWAGLARAASGAALLGAAAMPAAARDVKLPKDISWSAYETGSSGYSQSVGLGQMLTKNYGVGLRIIPGKNDVSRMTPLRVGQTQVCACGIAAYFAQEGVFMFADKNWGPQQIFNLFNNIGRNGAQIAVAADVGIEKASDLKGKRITFVKGAPALNIQAQAYLAFAGLTWNDVTKVEVPGFGQSLEAVLNGQADGVFGSTITSNYTRIAASPRGLYFPPMPHSDKAGWDRALAVAPWWSKSKVTNFTKGAKNTEPFEGASYPYPIFIVNKGVSDDVAYGLTKAVMENYDQFKDAGPGMDGYKLANQNLTYVMPYHPAAVEYYKEKGLWKDEQEKNNQAVLKRQGVLAAAWKAFVAKNVAADKFRAEWMKARAEALEKAGMPVIFR